MKKIFLSVFLLLSTQVFASEFHFPAYEKYQLPNGMTVYLLERHETPLINVKMVWKAGAVNDGKSFGLANFTADALFLGTKKYSKQELDEALEFYGASSSSSASSESIEASIQLNKKDWDQLMPLFKEVVMQPTFPKKEVAKRKAQLIDDLKQMKESPRSMIGREFASFIFAEHPYGNPVSGTEQSVAALSSAALKKFSEQYLQPDNAALIVAGDFVPREMKEKLAASFGEWKGSEKSVQAVSVSAPAFPVEARVLLVNKPDAHETTFMIGGKGITINDPHDVELGLANTILGARFTSWLNDALRVNSGLTYGARSRWNKYSTSGTFVISTFTKTKTSFPAIDLTLKTYQRIWEQGIDAATLASAKAYAKGQFTPNYETSGQLADFMGGMFVYGYDESYVNDYFKRVDALSLSDANKLARKFFPKDALQFVVIGQATELREGLGKYGKVTEKGL